MPRAKIIINDSNSIEEIRNKTLFDRILEATNEVVRFLRMARLQFENIQLKNIEEEERKSEENAMSEEKSYFSFQDTTSDEGTEDENSGNDKI